ncbi:MAG TPA: MBL fold metallo-hydrolase [Gaiellaceae bacterium]|nr:MBL fold metallo-hydrolase [Gaiellaceae bacterium]
MRLHVVGCSPAWPNPGGAQSGYLLEEDGRLLLLDCGPGVLARLREREPWPRVDAIAVTHLHLDHWGDLVPWAYGALYGAGRGVPAPALWLPPGGVDELRTLARIGAEAVLQVFELHEYAEGERFLAAGFELTPLPTEHYGEASFGFRVAGNESVLAYSADSGPSERLAELGRDADLFLLEATLAETERGTRGHLTDAEALETFRAAGARRLLVIHRPDELPLPDGVERARDGLEVDL